MSLLKKIGAAVGVGGAETQVVLDGAKFAWGDVVRGTVQVRAGAAEQVASEIKVSVREHWVSTDSDGDREDNYQHYSEIVVARDAALADGSAQEWSFEVTVPEGATPHHDWAVVARVCIPRAKDSHGTAAFAVDFPAEILGVVSALGSLAPFKQVASMVKGTEVDLDFRPPQELKKSLDGVRLILRPEETGVAGALEINPQERSVGDFLKALAKKDRVRHELRFSAAEFETAPGVPPAAVVERLRGLLQPYLG